MRLRGWDVEKLNPLKCIKASQSPEICHRHSPWRSASHSSINDEDLDPWRRQMVTLQLVQILTADLPSCSTGAENMSEELS